MRATALILMAVFAVPALAGDLKITTRPFAVHPDSMDMFPDGVFDIAVGSQYIGLYVANQGPAKTNVTATLSVPAEVTLLEPPTKILGNLPANSHAVLLVYKASFAGAAVGKPLLNLSFTYDGGLDSDSWAAFVGKSSKLEQGNRLIYLFETPEATATMEILTYMDQDPSVGALQEWSYSVQYKNPFEGQHGPLAFNDPWWKVTAWLAGAFSTGVAMGIGAGKIILGEPVKGVALAVAGRVANVAVITAARSATDVIDPIRRGQNLTVPGSGEKTVSETVHLTVDWVGSPELGKAGAANVTWRYVRVTDTNIYSHQLSEAVADSLHTSQGYTASVTPGSVSRGQELTVTATLTKSDGMPAKGGDAYGSFLLTKDKEDHVPGILRDDGLGGDTTANDGIYTGRVTVPMTFPTGAGQVFVVFQDINNVAKGTDPLVAAQTIGGFVITTPTWDAAGDLVPDATVTIN